MRLFTIVVLALASLGALAQKKNKQTEDVPAEKPAASKNAIDDKVAGFRKYPGYIEYYHDEKQDKVYLRIERFDSELLYIESLTAAVGSNDIGLDRNQLGREKVVKFQRRGPKVLLVQPNYGFRAISDNAAERKAVEEAFAQSVLAGFTITAESDGSVLVDASDFFLQDAHDVVGSLRNAQQGSYSLDKSRTAFYPERMKNFPKNSEFEVMLTFTGQPGGEYIRSVVPTPSIVTVRQHHSFVELPDADYKMRKFDPRAGYFDMSYFDYATPISEPIEKRFISRHRLKKKDPAAAVSEAVEPIIYYMDPGAPEPIRSALMEGARWWNQAFEAIGYKDAFRVELLPADADPMDVRYNVINWVHRSTRGWSYGATVADPRTGEIIKGHVTLGSLRVRQDFLIAEGLLAPYEDGKPVSTEMQTMALSRLRQLAAHEVGHTIGLAHAYSSSSENLASVMDYPHPVAEIKDGRIDLSKAYDDKIGAFDKVSIAYGYQDFPAGTDEAKALNDIIQNSLKAGLTFLSDQDARPLGGAHPYSHLWDNGSDPANELLRVLDVRSIAMKNFGEHNIRPGTPMALLEEALVPMYFFHRYQTEACAKVLGGLNYRYALRGDGQPVTELLTPQQQLRAMEALMKTVETGTLLIPESLLRQIPPRPMSYNRHRELPKGRTDLAFDPLTIAESAADMTFGLILHPARANRLFEYHARDARLPSLEATIDKLVSVSFKAPVKPGYEGAVQMSINNALFNNLSKLAVSKSASAATKGIAMLKLTQLQVWLTQRITTTPDEEWKGFYGFVSSSIKALLEDPGDFTQEPMMPPPPGQPIGDEALEYCSFEWR
jgi:hypothetical protein